MASRKISWHYLHRIDHTVIASTTMLNDRWSWILSHITNEYACAADDVDCIETDDGDQITVGGEPVAYLNTEFIDTNLKGDK